MNSAQNWDELKRIWTNQYVTTDSSQPQLRRFANLPGRVVTVNGNAMCLVEFQDGGWYDIAPQFLTLCPDQIDAAQRYNAKRNSAQTVPHRQA